MVRSNDKLQKYILEYRPVDLDQIYKHFRKFGLTYQTNVSCFYLNFYHDFIMLLLVNH